jgi:predicted double-glycine peptidase
VLRTVLPTSALLVAASWASPDRDTNSTSASNVQLFSGISGASRALIRISQADPVQYASKQEYNTWWSSTCSAASITEVINAYGHHYQLSDILRVETRARMITPELGLLELTGIDRIVAQFGFKATWLRNPSLDDVVTIANNGRPVIVNFPPSRWAGGHILVVRGGNKDSVVLADSSLLNMQVMARNIFVKYWDGLAVVVTPQ